jgi:hypothetical protein
MLANPITFQGVPSRMVPDRRRHKPILVTLFGRRMGANKEARPCKLAAISAGVAILFPVPVANGARLIAYFDHIARLCPAGSDAIMIGNGRNPEAARWLKQGVRGRGKSRQ